MLRLQQLLNFVAHKASSYKLHVHGSFPDRQTCVGLKAVALQQFCSHETQRVSALVGGSRAPLPW